jgi:hypothetical protein
VLRVTVQVFLYIQHPTSNASFAQIPRRRRHVCKNHVFFRRRYERAVLGRLGTTTLDDLGACQT